MLQWVDRVSRLQLVLQLSDEQCLRGAGQQLACQLLEILMGKSPSPYSVAMLI
jgi:hypothetical protein